MNASAVTFLNAQKCGRGTPAVDKLLLNRSLFKMPDPRNRHWLSTLALLTLAASTLLAGEPDAPLKAVGGRWSEMDYGSVMGCSFGAGGENWAVKGLTVKLTPTAADAKIQAHMAFDTELLRVSAGWTDGFLDWKGTAFDGFHGNGPNLAGALRFATSRNPGWANPADGNWTDPRKDKDGSLPAEWARYKGLYRSGEKVIFSYTVGDAKILEMPGVDVKDGLTVFSRTFNIGASAKPLLMNVIEQEGLTASVTGGLAMLSGPTERVYTGVMGAPAGVQLEAKGSRVILKVPATGGNFKLLIATVATADIPKFNAFHAVAAAPEDLSALTKGGPPRWAETIKTTGTLGKPSPITPYVVDTVTIPDENPWKSWMRLSGMDFFADGKRAAVCTWSGDVWIVSGLDEKLENLSWKRYAAGLYQPLGLKIVGEQIMTLGRDQITRFHDLNNDGEADFYECFNNDCVATLNFHEFAFDLQTDAQGNFYFAKASPVLKGGNGFDRISAHNGCLIKVSKDGSKSEIYATGLRAPNGICVGPNGEVTSGDNQGTWMPVCPINLIKPGSFMGVMDTAHRPTPPTKRDDPICWIPFSVDNSSGGQVWVTSDKWGPFKDQLLHCSYGKCSLFKVMFEHVGDTVQGGIVKFPLAFQSGLMRPRFNPVDGQLYVVGLKGWQTSAAKDGMFQRVRYTGGPVRMPTEIKVRNKGIDITFTCALNPEFANDVGSFAAEQFNVKWSAEYGSDEYSIADPTKKKHDPVEIVSAKLSADGKTVSLEMPKIQPVTNMIIKWRLKSADGAPMSQEIYNTINKVP